MKLLIRIISVLLLTLNFAFADNTLNGLGGTFPYPIYTKWATIYGTLTGADIRYQAISSTEGIKRIEAKTVDFGASDAPLDQTVLQKNGLVQFPMVIGGIVPIVNLPGIQPGQLKLSKAVFANIYLGKIKKWNDPAISALNPELNLPNLNITIVHRADGSGTTFILTSYLSLISDEWKKTVGSNTIVHWPTSTTGVLSSEDVSLTVKKVPGSIGCVEYSFAKMLTFISLQNKAGNFIAPSPDTFRAAAVSADWQHAVGFNKLLIDQSGNQSWPLAAATFILMQKTQTNANQALVLLQFFDWCYHAGSQLALQLDYVPLPENLIKLVEQEWKKQIVDSTGKSIWHK